MLVGIRRRQAWLQLHRLPAVCMHLRACHDASGNGGVYCVRPWMQLGSLTAYRSGKDRVQCRFSSLDHDDTGTSLSYRGQPRYSGGWRGGGGEVGGRHEGQQHHGHDLPINEGSGPLSNCSCFLIISSHLGLPDYYSTSTHQPFSDIFISPSIRLNIQHHHHAVLQDPQHCLAHRRCVGYYRFVNTHLVHSQPRKQLTLAQ